jgi:hypothetical protein
LTLQKLCGAAMDQTPRAVAGRTWAAAALCLLACAAWLAPVAWGAEGEAGAGEVNWQAKLEAKVADLRAQGQPVTFEEVVDRRPKLGDDENSALVFTEAFKLVGPTGAHFPIQLTAIGGMRQSEEVRRMARAYIEAHDKALKLIQDGARRSRGVYPIEAPKEPYGLAQMDYLQSARDAARLVVGEAAALADAGRTDEAARSLIACRRLCASMQGGPDLMSTLVRISIGLRLLDGCERCLELGELPAARLDDLRAELAREEEELSLEPALLGERAQGVWSFAAELGEAGDRVRSRPSQVDVQAVAEALGAVRDWLASDEIYWLETFDKALALLKLPPEKRWQQAAALEATVQEELGPGNEPADYIAQIKKLADSVAHVPPERRVAESTASLIGALPHPVSSMIMPPLGKLFLEDAKARSRYEITRTALALEQWRLAHGAWPESLEQLVPELLNSPPVDIFSGEKLRYRRTDMGIVLYSVGPDGRDNLGLRSEEVAQKTAAHDLPEGCQPGDMDISFRLLNPNLRGAHQMGLHEEFIRHNPGITLADLEEAGYSHEKLKAVGFTDEELAELKMQEQGRQSTGQ